MSKTDDPDLPLNSLDDEAPSKSQLKRDARAVLELAGRLLDARQSQIARLDLPEPVAAAITEGRAINRFGARKRHTQYLAKLLRKEADVDAIRCQLKEPPGRVQAEPEIPNERHEQMVSLLCNDQQAGFKRLREEYPTLALQRVSRLLRQLNQQQPTTNGHAKAHADLLALLEAHSK
jgi:ribosome-associated protein